jgi:hypothetical protein
MCAAYDLNVTNGVIGQLGNGGGDAFVLHR